MKLVYSGSQFLNLLQAIRFRFKLGVETIFTRIQWGALIRVSSIAMNS